MGTDERRVDVPDPPQIHTEVVKSGDVSTTNKLLIGTATLGLIRFEWHQARIGQIIPVNWSALRAFEMLGSYVPLGFLVADAQNLIVAKAVELDIEWLLLYEDDVIPPPDAFVKFNRYMISEEHPIVSGLYHTKSRPADPLIFRGRGNGFYNKWKQGDLVWADGVPTGFLLIHMSIIREMWPDCEPYRVKDRQVRRMFRFPRDMWHDPETGNYRTIHGTSDLDWCTRVMEGGYFKRAGWLKHQRKKYPFLVDTSISCYHIDKNGELYP